MKTFGVTLTLLVAGLALAFAVARPASSASTGGTLAGSVGPGFSISLSQNGTRVTHLEPGDYTIVVNDQSDIHNFHLFGPGAVDKSTSVDGTGQTTFTVTLVTGTYTYDCDAHPASMIGKFTVGDVPTVTDTTPTQVLKAGSSLKALHR